MKLNLGENIRKYRKRIDWTQEQLADRLGVSCQSVSRWESGNGYPDMEHLPTLARLFSVTMDELLGWGQPEERFTNDQLGKILQDAVDSQDPEQVIPVLRMFRYEYLDVIDSRAITPLLLLRPGKLTESERFMEKLRQFCGEYLEDGKKQFIKNNMLDILTELDDDEHFRELLEKYADGSRYDYTLLGMRMKRAGYQKDNEEYKRLRAIRTMLNLCEYLEPKRVWFKEWPKGCRELPEDIEEGIPPMNPEVWLRDSERRLNILHAFNDIVPDEAHPVSGNGVLDLWGAVRVEIGFFYAAQLSACGQYDRALTVLEDCTSLVEQAFDGFEGGIRNFHINRTGYMPEDVPAVTCNAPELAGVVARRGPSYGRRGMKRVPDIHFFYMLVDVRCEQLQLGIIQCVHLHFLTERNLPREGFLSSWFDPIRNHPRYLAVVERIRKCEE